MRDTKENWSNDPRMKQIANQQITNMVRSELRERAKNGFFSQPYPGYPTERYSTTGSDLTIPAGPWDTANEHAKPLNPGEIARLGTDGVRFDDLGRPLHPWIEDFVHDPNIGVISGPGAYWNYGENPAADPIYITRLPQPMVLLIRRRDTGSLALSGGFRNKTTQADGSAIFEDPVIAALREGKEEAGLRRPWFSRGQRIYSGLVGDRRVTAHAWVHSTAILFRPILPWPVHGRDDALQANWYPINKLPDQLFGSHRILVELAKQVVKGEIEIVGDEDTVTQAT